MSESRLPDGFESLSSRVREAVFAFENDWRAGNRRDIDEVVEQAGLGGDEWELRVRLIEIEFELRLAESGRETVPRVEDYLTRYPRLTDPLTSAVVWELIRLEVRAFQKKKIDITLDEYAARFPRHRDALRRLFSGHGSTPAPLISGYEIGEVLGQGGFGIVYRAKHRKLNRSDAIKVLSTRFNGPTAHQFNDTILHEAQIVAGLSHPNVVKIHDTGETEDGGAFFSMEVLDGGSLQHRISKAPLDIHESARLVADLASAVQTAHDSKILHCDIKPGNVLYDGNGTPKLCDFGLARRLGENADRTETELIRGTPGYMAPEQAADGTKQIQPLVDLYALGAVLYACLTGKAPRVGTHAEIVNLLRSGTEPPLLRTIRPDVPRDLETVCENCLRTDPKTRYASAGALHADLIAFLEGRPVQARPVGPVTRGLKWVKRNPVPSALAAAVLFALLFATGYFREQQLAAEAVAAERGLRLDAEGDVVREQSRGLREKDLARAKLAFQRGQLKDAVDALDAVADLPPELRLEKARALYNLTMEDRFLQEFQSIDPTHLKPDLRARWHLLHGEHLLAQDQAAAENEIDAALAIPEFSPAERAFARGLRAKSNPEALTFFRSAYTQEPYYLSARLMGMVTLLALGRLEELIAVGRETRLLYPDDAQAAVLLLVAHSIRGQENEARKLVPSVRKQLPTEFADAFEAFIPILGLFNYELAYSKEQSQFDTALVQIILSGKFNKIGALLQQPGRVPALSGQLRVPPSVRPLLNYWIKLNPLSADDFTLQKLPALLTKLVQPKKTLTPNELVELSEIVELNPESYLLAQLATDINQEPYPNEKLNTVAGWEAYQNGDLKAAQLYERAFRAEGSIPKVRTLALDMAIGKYCMSGKPIHQHKLPVKMDRMAKALKLLRVRWKSDSWHEQPFLMPLLAFRVAHWGQDYGLAFNLLHTWKPTNRSDEATWYFCRALLDTDLGAYRSAIEAITEARKRAVPDPNNELDVAEKRCRAALEMK